MTPKMKKALADVQKCMKIMRNFCAGYCTIMVSEGCRAYAKLAPTIGNTNVCNRCGRDRYNGEYDNE